MKRATIYDVARRAGVSHQTVTRHLSGFEGIRQETRARVETALAELNYRPNSAARMLRLRRINRIAVLAHNLEETGPARIIVGAAKEARRRGYVLDIIGMDGNDPESVDTAIELAVEHQVAGLLATAQTEVVLEQVHHHPINVPLVIDVAVKAAGSELSANELTGRLAADHLMDLGHRLLGYVSGPAIWFAAQGRRRGFENRVKERGGAVAWVREGDWSAVSGHGVWSSVTQAEQRVTAIAAANDSMAIGLISALHDQGIRVPADMSVMGTDDLPESRYLLPALSTIALDFEAEGRLAVSRLVDLIEGVVSGSNGHSDWVLQAPVIRSRTSTRTLA